MAQRRDAHGPVKGSIIVPAYKECPNLKPLTERLFAALKEKNMQAELIVVDDNSRDGSEEAVNELAKTYNVRIIVRTKERGLSSAVLRGFQEAKGDYLVCMDADLQHPPEKVPEMLAALEKHEYALGTRYGDGFNVDKDWPMYRQIMSQGARALARPLTPLSDPMSGFFGLRRSTFERGAASANQQGFKIALELYVKCKVKSHAEVPIHFSARVAGESKLSGKVMLHYLDQLQQLYRHKYSFLLILLLLLVVFVVYAGFKMLIR